jgi:hypothetical protein
MISVSGKLPPLKMPEGALKVCCRRFILYIPEEELRSVEVRSFSTLPSCNGLADALRSEYAIISR